MRRLRIGLDGVAAIALFVGIFAMLVDLQLVSVISLVVYIGLYTPMRNSVCLLLLVVFWFVEAVVFLIPGLFGFRGPLPVSWWIYYRVYIRLPDPKLFSGDYD